MRATLVALIALIIGVGSYVLYHRRRTHGVSLSPAAQICVADFPDAPIEQSEARCNCVIAALEKTDEGREVLELVIENKHFLRMIESAASHASVLDAMNECAR